MNTHFRCLESRIDKNNTLYGKFSLNSILSGQGNTFANSLRRSLFSDLSGLAITHFCITSKPGLSYEFATLPGLTESLLDFSLNLKKVVLTGRVIDLASFTNLNKHKFVSLHGQPFRETSPSKALLSLPCGCSYSYGVAKQSKACLPYLPVGYVSKAAKGMCTMQSGHSKQNKKESTSNLAYKSRVYLSCFANKHIASNPFAIDATYLLALQLHRSKSNPAGCFASKSRMCLPASQAKQVGYASKQVRHVLPSKKQATAMALEAHKQPIRKNKFCFFIGPDSLTRKLKYKTQQKSKNYRATSWPDDINSTTSRLYLDTLKASILLAKRSTEHGQKVSPSLPIAPIGFLKAKGPAVLRASDLILPPGIRCVHPNQYLGTLAADGALSIKFLIAVGKGFVVQDEIFYNSLSRAKLLLSSNVGYAYEPSNLQNSLPLDLLGSSIHSTQNNSLISEFNYLNNKVDNKVVASCNVQSLLTCHTNLAIRSKHICAYNSKNCMLLRSKKQITTCKACKQANQEFVKDTSSSRKIQKFQIYPQTNAIAAKDLVWLLPSYCVSRWVHKEKNTDKASTKNNNFYQKLPRDLRFSGPSQLLPMATKALTYFFTKSLSANSISDLIIQSSIKVKSKASLLSSLTNKLKKPYKIYNKHDSIMLKKFYQPTGTTKLQSAVDIKQNKKAKLTFLPAKPNIYNGFNNELEKEKLLTIVYKAQTNKFSPFLFASIAYKKVENKNLLVKRNKGIVTSYMPNKSVFAHAKKQTTACNPFTLVKGKNAFPSLQSKQNKKHVNKLSNLCKIKELNNKKINHLNLFKVGSANGKLEDRGKQATITTIRDLTRNFSPYGNLTNTVKKLSKKQLIWGAEENFYPVLPLDVTFTPISKVNFQINVDRNSEKNEETIIFEIWTNGSITPKRAIQESCLALAQDFYNLFCHVNEFSSLQFWWKRDSFKSKTTRAANSKLVLSENLILKEHEKLLYSPNKFSRSNIRKMCFNVPKISTKLLSKDYNPICFACFAEQPLLAYPCLATQGMGKQAKQVGYASKQAKQIRYTSKGDLKEVSKQKQADIVDYKGTKKTHSQVKLCTKIKFPESENFKLKQKIHYLHAFWRLNISDLNFSLKTQLLLKKLNVNSVYDLHFFILKKSWSLFLNRQQQEEIIKIYLNFGLNSPF